MFKKILASILSVAFLATPAMASTVEDLQSAYDDYSYAVTVEWDQKDPAFLEAKQEELTKKIVALKEQGLSNADLLNFAKGKMKSAALAEELENILSMVSANRMGPEEAQLRFVEAMKNASGQGVSWNGRPGWGFYVALGLGIAVTTAYFWMGLTWQA